MVRGQQTDVSHVHQFRCGCTKGRRDSEQVLDADALLAAFDLTDVGAMEVGFFGKLFLGPAPLLTQFPDSMADFTYHLFKHAEDCARKTPISLQPIDSGGGGETLGATQCVYERGRGGEEFPEAPEESQRAEDLDGDSDEARGMASHGQGIDAQRDAEDRPQVDKRE